MTTQLNSFGELHTKWTSHKHPENENFMQLVYWNVWEKNGKTTICWSLGSGSQTNYIYGMSKDEAIVKYSDKPETEITEDAFEEWLKKRG